VITASRPTLPVWYPKNRYFDAAYLLDPLEPFIDLIRTSFIIALAILIMRSISLGAFLSYLFYYGAILLSNAFILMFESLGIYVGNIFMWKSGRRHQPSISFLILCYAPIVFVTLDILQRNALHVNDLKFAGLIFGLSLSMQILVKVLYKPATFELLKQIRRNMLCGNIHPNRAGELIDETLRGITIEKIWEKEIEDIMHLVQQLEEQLQVITQKIETSTKLLREKPIDYSSLQKVYIEIGAILKSHQKLYSKYKFIVSTLLFRIGCLGIFMEEIDKAQLKARAQSIASKLKNLAPRYKQLDSQVVIMKHHLETLKSGDSGLRA
jgi:hypothetical protein